MDIKTAMSALLYVLFYILVMIGIDLVYGPENMEIYKWPACGAIIIFMYREQISFVIKYFFWKK